MRNIRAKISVEKTKNLSSMCPGLKFDAIFFLVLGSATVVPVSVNNEILIQYDLGQRPSHSRKMEKKRTKVVLLQCY